VFRWRREDDGSWVGVDGGNAYRFEVSTTGLRTKSDMAPEAVRSFFRLDMDAAEVELEILRRGPELRSAIDQLQGIRLMRPSSLVETFFTFMCTANNNLHRIIPMSWKLGEFGEPLDNGLHAFPAIDRIASIGEQELRQAGFGYRGATIPKSAKALLERGAEDWLEQLRQADYAEIHLELCGLPGIGPKLADCIALYGYDRGEAVPLDTHIWQAFTRLYHPEWKDKAVTDFRYRDSTQRFRERFGKLSGWAHLFLFYENLSNSRSRKQDIV